MRLSGRSAACSGSLCNLAKSLAFDVSRQDDAEVQAYGICQPWGIKGGRARPSFVGSNGGFQGEEIEIFPLNGFLVSLLSAFAPFLRPALDCKLFLPLSSFHEKKKAATR